MVSDTKIANLALSHLGIGKMISDLTTETGSQEAKAAREFYPVCRDLVLRKFEWPFASAFQVLGLVEENPTGEWAFSYRYPSNSIKIRRLVNPSVRNDTRQSRVNYRLARDTIGVLIYTDLEDACAEYTYHEKSAERYSDDFVIAVSFLLAAYLAPRLTAGDPFKLGERATRFYLFQIAQAEVSAVNEEQPEEEVESEFIRERNNG